MSYSGVKKQQQPASTVADPAILTDNQIRFELIKLAREIVHAELTDSRLQNHRKWVANNDESWKTNRVRIPYPAQDPYPTEEVIIARAMTMYNFVVPPIEELELIEETPPEPTVRHLLPGWVPGWVRAAST